MTPIIFVGCTFVLRRRDARALGVKPLLSAYDTTLSRSSAEIIAEPLRARDTVETDTPRSRARSFIVRGLLLGIMLDEG